MMRTVSFLLAALLAAMFPASASAAVTYTCSESALAPISVVDPMGGDAQRVSEFISRCTAANGTASGPTEGAACDGGGRWATVQSQMVCQPATLTAAAQLSDACIKQNQCSASENAFLDNQKAVQNDPRSVPLDATAQQRLLEQAQQAQAQANAQATRVVAAPANNNAFCQGGTCTYVPLWAPPGTGKGSSGT